MMKSIVCACAALSIVAAAAAASGAEPAASVVVRHAKDPDKVLVFDVGDTIEVVVSVPPGTAETGPVAVRWIDSYDRVVAEASRPAGQRVSVQFPVRACVSTGNRIEILREGRPLAEPVPFGCAPQYTRPLRDWYVFPWAQYPVGTGDTLRSVGVNGGMAYKLIPFGRLVANDMRFYVDQMAWEYYGPYKKDRAGFRAKMDPFLKEWNETGVANTATLTREPCLSDPETMKRLREHLQRHVRLHAPYKPVWYNIQDEGGMAGQNQRNEFCYGPHCLIALRTFLKEQYGSLAVLNEAWGTTFATWDDVKPMTSYEVRRREKDVPLEQKRLGPWCDHRASQDLVMTRALARGREFCREIDPGGLFGMTGTQEPSPWPAFDYSLVPTAVDIAHYYDYGNAQEIARSFHPRYGSRTFPYPGWSTGTVRVRQDWYYLFHGLACTGIWDQAMTLLDRDGRPTPKVLAFKDTFLELQRGIGRLFINAVRDDDPIGIHFSQPSLRVRALAGDDPALAGGAGYLDDAGVMRALEDLGFQYNFVAYREVEEGLLTKGGYRLYFLLNAVALSDKEAAALDAWVASGGVLVTDSRAGLFDQHGRGRPEPALSRLTKGSPADQSDAFDVFRHGRGRVIRLKALPLAAYPAERVTGGASVAPVKAAVGRILKVATLRARFPVLDADGQPAHGVETVVFTDGAARYLAIFRNPGYEGFLMRRHRGVFESCFPHPVPVSVQFPGPGEVHDIRGGRHLGQPRSVPATLEPFTPLCYAVLPYRVTGLSVDAPSKASPGETVRLTCTVRPDGGAPVGHHVLRVDVFGSDGVLRMHYSRNLETSHGTAAMTIPLALNDAPGTWRVAVRDVASGTAAEATVVVTAAESARS